MLLKPLRLVSAAALLSCVLTSCDDDAGGSTAAPTSREFCGVYAEHRDGPPDGAAEFADELEAVGAPDGLGDADRSGLTTYLAYLRDQGDGHDEDQYEDEYAVVLPRPARADLVAFLDAADEQCGTARGDEGAPTDATKADYCAAFEDVFGSGPSDRLQRAGTPTGLGADSGLAVESRHGFRAVADVVAHLTPAQAEVLDAGDDDEMRQLVGVTDAFFADTWFLASFGLCVGYD